MQTIEINGYRIKSDGSIWEICRTYYCDEWRVTYHFRRLMSSVAAAKEWAERN